MEITKIIAICGGQLKLAEFLGISQPAVSQWRHVPVFHVLTIEKEFVNEQTFRDYLNFHYPFYICLYCKESTRKHRKIIKRAHTKLK